MTEHGVGALGRSVKEVAQKAPSPHRLSIDGSVPSLPKFVAVGDRNTGKSLLIEAITKIPLPRSANTCTRCPLAINLTETTEQHWSCEVFLQKKYIYQADFCSRRRSSYQPFSPWIEHGHEDLHFASLTHPVHIVDALERAQLAILNPSSAYKKYKPGNPLVERGCQVQFSPNVIRLDVCGPGLSSSSFYDLPGVIKSTEDSEEADFIPLIRNLVREYIQDDKCINLLALAMTDDVCKLSALALVKEAKAEARTVGCLAKPDRINRREEFGPWIRLLQNDEDQLGFGYYVVKNYTTPAADYVTTRNEEAPSFPKNEPWKIALSGYSHRFGIHFITGGEIIAVAQTSGRVISWRRLDHLATSTQSRL